MPDGDDHFYTGRGTPFVLHFGALALEPMRSERAALSNWHKGHPSRQLAGGLPLNRFQAVLMKFVAELMKVTANVATMLWPD